MRADTLYKRKKEGFDVILQFEAGMGKNGSFIRFSQQMKVLMGQMNSEEGRGLDLGLSK